MAPRGVETGSSGQVLERTAAALGWIAVGNRADAVVDAVVAALFAQAPTRGLELHLAVGEALACAGAGWSCAALDDWRRDEDDDSMQLTAEDGADAHAMDVILRPILATYGPSPQPAVRQAAVLWLLALLRHAGHHAAVQVRCVRRGRAGGTYGRKMLNTGGRP